MNCTFPSTRPFAFLPKQDFFSADDAPPRLYARRAPPKHWKKCEKKPLSYYGKDSPPPTPPPLSREDENATFERYARRKTAKDREILVRQYLCFAFGVASKFKGPRLCFDDAISAANEGLVEALDSFDPSRGYRFTTYAAFVLRRKLIEAIVATYPVKVSDHMRKSLKALQLDPEELAREISEDEEPRTLEEFFERLGESSDVDIGKLHERPEDAPFCPAEGASPAEEAEEADMSAELKTALRKLSNLERAAIKARYFSEPRESYEEIGRRMRVSKNRVREAHDTAIVHLRKYLQHFGQPTS